MVRPIRVFESADKPGPIVKYVDSFVRHAPEDIEYSFFSWWAALFSRYDVFHVHWPEFLIRDHRPLARAIRRTLYELLLLRLRAFKTPVVRTVHNARPHEEGGEKEERALTRLDNLVVERVVLSNCTPTPEDSITTLIPHGHFRDVFATPQRVQPISGRILLFGRLERYKGAFQLLDALEDVATEPVELRIVGAPGHGIRKELMSELSRKDRRGPKVSAVLRRVSDEEMVREMLEAELVVLPYQDAGNGNSGVALVALSLDRPVLSIDSCITRELAEEVGSDWMYLADAVSGEVIDETLTQVHTRRSDARPKFSGRDWTEIAAAYARVFRRVART